MAHIDATLVAQAFISNDKDSNFACNDVSMPWFLPFLADLRLLDK